MKLEDLIQKLEVSVLDVKSGQTLLLNIRDPVPVALMRAFRNQLHAHFEPKGVTCFVLNVQNLDIAVIDRTEINVTTEEEHS